MSEDKTKFGYTKIDPKLHRPGQYYIVFEGQSYYAKTLASFVGFSTSKLHSNLIRKFNGKLYKARINVNNRVYFEKPEQAQAAAEWLDAMYVAKKLLKRNVNV